MQEGEDQQAVVRTSRVEIVNAAGQVRAFLGMGDDDAVSMGLLDPQGRLTVQVGCDAAGGGVIALLDGNGMYRAALALYPDGVPVLELFDAAGQLRAQVGVTEEGVQRLRFIGDGGAAAIDVGPDAEGRLMVFEPSREAPVQRPGSAPTGARRPAQQGRASARKR